MESFQKRERERRKREKRQEKDARRTLRTSSAPVPQAGADQAAAPSPGELPVDRTISPPNASERGPLE